MRKSIAVLLAAAMTASLVACGGTSSTKTTETSAVQQDTTETEKTSDNSKNWKRNDQRSSVE